jgi:hypothetical protein
MLYLTNLPTSYLVEYDFSLVTALLSQVCNCLDDTAGDDICVSLTTLQLDIQKCANVQQDQGTH